MNNQTRKELVQYFGFTFVFAWLFWLPSTLTYLGVINAPAGLLGLLKLVGAVGPAVIALILTGRQAGKPGLKQMMVSSFNVKAHWKFWIGAVLLLLGLHAASRFVLTLISSAPPPSPSPLATIPMFIVMFLIGGGLGEEIGWRGYSLDRLQTKYNALNASLLLVVVWIVWHLPLFFYGDTSQSLIPFRLFILSVIPLGVMLTWVYNNTKTIFAAAMFHTVGNFAHELFLVRPIETHPELTGFIILTGFYYAAAIVIVVIYGAKTLRRHK